MGAGQPLLRGGALLDAAIADVVYFVLAAFALFLQGKRLVLKFIHLTKIVGVSKLGTRQLRHSWVELSLGARGGKGMPQEMLVA